MIKLLLKKLYSANLLVLFSGASVLSFGLGYQGTTLWLRGEPLRSLATNPMGLPQRSLAGLPLASIEQTLHQASFKFLTRSAYSLVTPAEVQPAAFEGFDIESITDG